jgi:hypothetical protein
MDESRVLASEAFGIGMNVDFEMQSCVAFHAKLLGCHHDSAKTV